MKKILMISTLAMLSVNVRAEVLEYSFTDTNNQVVNKPANVAYINPKSTIEVVLSAGLDRKIRLTVMKGATAINTQLSEIVGINDRMQTSDGREFYGKRFTVPKLSDGEYQIVQEVLDTANKLVKTEATAIKVDTVAPTIGAEIAWVHAGYRGGSIEVFAHTNATQEINVAQLSDSDSGLSHADYFAVLDGVKRTTRATLNIDEGRANAVASLAAGASVAPNPQAKYTIGFDVYDAAGNKATISRLSTIDRVTPSAEIQVKNAKTGVYEPYQSGMKIYAQPVTVRYVMKKSEHTDFNGTDYGWLSGQYNNQDTNNVYLEFTINYPQAYSYRELYTKAGLRRWMPVGSLNFTPDAGVPLAPEPAGLKAEINHDGAWKNASLWEREPFTVSKVLILAKQKTYRQKAWVSGTTPCYIEPGETSCVVNTNIERVTGKGYTPYAYYVQDIETGLGTVHGGYVLVHWDFNDPIINKAEINGSEVSMQVINQDAVNNWARSKWVITKYEAYAANGQNRHSLPRTKLVSEDYRTANATFSAAGLPDGNYEISVVAGDNYGNETTTIVGNHVIDNTPPSIAVFAENKALVDGQTVLGLESINIKLSDLHGPDITEVNISGGPISDSIYLDWVKLDGTNFKLEYPRIFPSLEENQSYTLTVKAIDSYGNTSTKSHSIDYIPNNLFTLTGVDVFATDELVLSKNGKPLSLITSNQLRSDNGNLASGEQQIFFTLRGDAPFGLYANGVRVRPGETKEVIYNLDSTDGRIYLPIYPDVKGVEGKANYLIEIPRIN